MPHPKLEHRMPILGSVQGTGAGLCRQGHTEKGKSLPGSVLPALRL